MDRPYGALRRRLGDVGEDRERVGEVDPGVEWEPLGREVRAGEDGGHAAAAADLEDLLEGVAGEQVAGLDVAREEPGQAPPAAAVVEDHGRRGAGAVLGELPSRVGVERLALDQQVEPGGPVPAPLQMLLRQVGQEGQHVRVGGVAPAQQKRPEVVVELAEEREGLRPGSRRTRRRSRPAARRTASSASRPARARPRRRRPRAPARCPRRGGGRLLPSRGGRAPLPSPWARCSEERPALVLAEDLAQRSADLADRGAGAQRLLHRRQQVARLRRPRPSRARRAAPRPPSLSRDGLVLAPAARPGAARPRGRP